MATTNFYKEILSVANQILVALGGTVNTTAQTPSTGTATTASSQALAAGATRAAFDFTNTGTENIILSVGVTASNSPINGRIVLPNQTYESRAVTAKKVINVITVSGSSTYTVQEFLEV